MIQLALELGEHEKLLLAMDALTILDYSHADRDLTAEHS